MGKAGQPVDPAAWEWRRQRAVWLLRQGYSQALVARSVGTSKSWVQRVDQARRVPEHARPRSLTSTG